MRQSQALRILMNGDSVFLTGAPGAGKSYSLHQFVRMAVKSGKKVAVTASTGIAATHIGGTTIHSWTGIGIREQLTQHDITIYKGRNTLVKRYVTTDVLVIDEVSMLAGRFLDMVNQMCKAMRENNAPFGGMQVVLVGDMFQLPPINRASRIIDFAHKSEAWRELQPKVCYLTEQHRQTSGGLLDVLEAMRTDSLSEYHTDILQQRLSQIPDGATVITRLYAHNIDVDTINARHLQALSGDMETYTMTTKGAGAKIEQLTRGVLAPARLELKIGAEVMFVANNFAAGYANGSRGQVVALNGDYPEVRLLSNKRVVTVEPYTWQLVEDGKVRAETSQIPLRLAWAITIHKSQGMSLDAAEIDLSRTFTPGMGYVALSRVRDLAGVYLKGINQMALRLHPDIFELDQALRQASVELGLHTEDYVEALQPITEYSPKIVDEVLLQELKVWRKERAEANGVPAYTIAHNKLLELIAIKKPNSKQELLAIKGIGIAKLDKIGDDILRIIRKNTHSIDNEPPLRNTSWTPREDTLLSERLLAGIPLETVCAELHKTPGAVWARAATLLNQTTNTN